MENSCRDAYEGAREDLLDWKRRALTAEAAIRQIRAAISTDSCDGDSSYAAGVNAAVARHTEGIDTILKDAGIKTGK